MSLGMNYPVMYNQPVTEHSVAGCCNPNPTRRTAPDRRFFMPGQILFGGLRGATERLTGVLVGQVATPAFVRRQLCCKSSGGFPTTRKPL